MEPFPLTPSIIQGLATIRDMNGRAFDSFCRALPATTYVNQWGGAHVWKVGGKLFAIGSWDTGHAAITFKVSPIAFEILKSQPGLRPAPYLASRGLTWIQHFAAPGFSDAELRSHIQASYEIVAQGLPRKTRLALGFLTAE